MSKRFKKYSQQLNALAEEIISERISLENRLKKAEADAKQYPTRYGLVAPEYAVESQKAELELKAAQKAKLQFDINVHGKIASGVNDIRRAFVKEVSDVYAVNPKGVDPGTVELLKSGVMTPDDFAKTITDAKDSNNVALMRLAAKYAREEAEKIRSNPLADQGKAALYMAAASQATDRAAEIIDLFDSSVEILRTLYRSGSLAEWHSCADALLDVLGDEYTPGADQAAPESIHGGDQGGDTSEGV